MKFLLAHGAEINVKNQADGTPLAFAAANGRLATARFLLSQDVDVNVKDEIGRTALWWAGRGAHTGVIKLLRKGWCDDGFWPYYEASATVRMRKVSLFCRQGERNGPQRWARNKLPSRSSQVHAANILSLPSLGLYPSNPLGPKRRQWGSKNS